MIKDRSKILVFALISIIYFIITMVFYLKTTIFYDTKSICDVVLDTDTGILIKWNTFAMSQDNSKHILFMQIVSLLAYPLCMFSIEMANSLGVPFNDVYGLGLIIIQILVSATSITMVYAMLKDLKIKKEVLILLTTIMVFSFPQLLMTLNVERFIYAQLSLVLFVFVVSRIKNKNSYIIDALGLPLFGITLTNVYLYILNLILQFKTDFKSIIKHLGAFVLMAYVAIVSSRAYEAFFAITSIVKSDTKFVAQIGIIEKIKMTLVRLMYTTIYFPSAEYGNKMYLQQGMPNLIFIVLFVALFVCAILGGVKYHKQRVAQLCLGIVLANIALHGVIGFNLKNASIMAIHFSFAIIILLAYFSKSLNAKFRKIFTWFLVAVLVSVIVSNVIGFSEIFNIGITKFSK